ncbi:hypothetical protein [Mitsuaria sp. GD03876]|uniref:hypothetical protein n=1 Tax=Mitsuaria sp. GD03876 TaxID=2975399 RepID=UPI00244ADF51|nr:hypothetical protein [Mitsuaria sp. GD03876]MDH0863512.1 hypothetical protein [Mitsuaria sp. GD03876]
MSNVVTPGRAAAIKSALESAFIAVLASGVCLWFLISESQVPGEGDPARLTMFSIGLAIGLCAHLVYLGIALKRAGRGVVIWMIALICLLPFASVVLGILLFNQVQEMEQQAREQGDARPAA